MQYTYSIHIVYIQYTYSIHKVYIQYTYSIHIVYIQYTYSMHIVYIQYTYSIHWWILRQRLFVKLDNSSPVFNHVLRSSVFLARCSQQAVLAGEHGTGGWPDGLQAWRSGVSPLTDKSGCAASDGFESAARTSDNADEPPLPPQLDASSPGDAHTRGGRPLRESITRGKLDMTFSANGGV